MTDCLRAEVPMQIVSRVTGIRTMQVIRDHYDDLDLDDSREALRALDVNSS